MDERRFSVTMRDITRYRILMDCLEKKIKATQASQLLGLSYIHTLRLKKKVAQSGLDGLLRPYRPSPKKTPEDRANLIANLYRDLYPDFNILHFKDKLADTHKIFLSYESIRQILINAGLHKPRRKRKAHRRRRRMPKAGMLVQMDSSKHRWLEHIPQEWWLIAMIDDASNEVPYARFFPRDALLANMYVIRRFIERKGLFMALYADKASHFKTTRHGGIHYQVNPEHEETQIERALNELDINLIPANSPQAKGRVERLFGLLQDRLIKEMRLAKIKNYTQANRFLLKTFLPWYNGKYTHKVESAYTRLPGNVNLDLIFCIKKQRKVKGDNTIQIDAQTIQIPPSNIRLSFARAWVDVCILDDRRIYVVYKDSIIAVSKLSKNKRKSKTERQIESLLNAREYSTCAL
jgi:hypothetical protein